MIARTCYLPTGFPTGLGLGAFSSDLAYEAKALHPDRSKAADAHERFQELQEAYQMLSKNSSASDDKRQPAEPGAAGVVFVLLGVNLTGNLRW